MVETIIQVTEVTTDLVPVTEAVSEIVSVNPLTVVSPQVEVTTELPPVQQITTVIGQKPSSAASSPALLTDYTHSRYQYLGYTTRIVRLDHSTSPPVVAECFSTDWPGRVGLEYV